MSADNEDDDSASKIVVTEAGDMKLWAIGRCKLPFVGRGHVYRGENDGARRDHELSVSARQHARPVANVNYASV